MRGDDLVKILEVAGRSIASQAEHDPDLKASLSRIGRWLIEIAEQLPDADRRSKDGIRTDVAGAAAEFAQQNERALDGTDRKDGATVADDSPQRERLIEPAQPTITGPRVVAQPLPAPRSIDLSLIQKRCRIKSESARWAIARRRRLAEGADFKSAIAPTDHELIERAKGLPNCYLWMIDPYGIMPPDDPVLSVIDACYTNLADAVALVLDVQRKQEESGAGYAGSGNSNDEAAGPGIEEPVRLLAEAQSALRVALHDSGLRADQDQIDAFAWLKEFTYVERIYLERFMRLDNAADPQNWSDLHDRIERLRDAMDETRARVARRTKLLNRARYHARKLGDGDLDDWRKILAAVDELVEAGIPPSDLEIREILLPLLDEIPEEIELGPGAVQAAREVDRYVASREASRDMAPPPLREPSQEVQTVAAVLKGRTVVLIGGDERPGAARAIQRAFELERLRWISAKPHQSTTTFEPEVARDETALVLLAIRFSSHSFEGVKAMCDRYGKPFVRLPGGYGVNQIARQILLQVGNRLART